MSSFRKKTKVSAKILRDRLAHINESDDESDDVMELTSTMPAPVIGSSSATKALKDEASSLAMVASSSSLLSFADEEDEDTIFVVKKKKRKERKSGLSKSSTKSMPQQQQSKQTQRHSPDSSTAARATENKVRVAEADSTSSSSNAWMGTGDEAEAVIQQQRRTKSEAELKKMLGTGIIPDANTIHLARKQRQHARETGEFVPLEQPTTSKSRLVREEEGSDEEPMIVMSSRNQMEEQRRVAEREEFLNIEQGDSDEERDEEFEAWEQEQLRKAVTKSQMVSMQQDAAWDPSNSPRQPNAGVSKSLAAAAMFNAGAARVEHMGVGPKSGLLGTPVMHGGGNSLNVQAISLEDAKKRIEDSLGEHKTYHRGKEERRDNMADGMVGNQETIAGLEEAAPRLSVQYAFYQEIRAYMLDLLDCWNEKVPKLEALEASLQRLWRERRDYLVKRRRADVQDEYQQCSALATGKLPEVHKDSDRKIRVAEREARRNRRRMKRTAAMTNLRLEEQHSHREGLSTDDEEVPSRLQTMKTSRDKVFDGLTTLFADVDDDFSALASVLSRVERWMKEHGDSFEQAYIGDCLPKLLGPIIRRELIGWNPLLTKEATQLSDFTWYRELEAFCGRCLPADPPDDLKEITSVNLIPAIVEKIVCPKIKVLVEDCWDCASTSQTIRLISTLRSLVTDYPTISPSSKYFTSIVEKCVDRMKSSLDDDLFIPLYPRSVLEHRQSGAGEFVSRQFWFCFKILQNVLLWEGFLNPELVLSLALDSIVSRYLLLGLQTTAAATSNTAAIDNTHVIIGALPTEYVTADNAHLDALGKWLVRFAEDIHRAYKDQKATPESASSEIREVQKILVKLKRTNLALEIADKCRIPA